jgi:hypothetical protein
MPGKTYLHVEALNLDSTVFDTDKLSVTRGGGLLIREAMAQIESELNDFLKLGTETCAISTGASIGVYQVDSDRLEKTLCIVGNIINNAPYQHFTFAVTDAESSEKAKIQAKFRQFQQMTVLPDIASSGSVCAWSKVRRADGIVHANENGSLQQLVSSSIKDRHEFGRGEKLNQKSVSLIKAFYTRETAAPNDYDDQKWKDLVQSLRFSNEFSEIASRPPREWAHLNHKLALIYVDGNKFSRFVDGKTDEQVCKFDQLNRGLRKILLGKLVEKISTDKEFKNDDIKRFEVLMWGGDEFELLVPAWCGFALAQWLFAQMQDWKHDEETLGHAMGLVFFHYKTPISRIRNLARELATNCKDRMTTGTLANAYDYLVCESIDFPAQSLDAFWASRLCDGYAAARRPLKPHAANINGLRQLLSEMPRAQVYRVAEALSVASIDLSQREKRADEQIGTANLAEAKKWFEPFAPDDKSKHLLWLHLRELMDYLVPRDAQAASENASPLEGAP